MPKNPNIKKVLVIGSGPIVIGQAAEFDYAGTQACRYTCHRGQDGASELRDQFLPGITLSAEHSAHVTVQTFLYAGRVDHLMAEGSVEIPLVWKVLLTGNDNPVFLHTVECAVAVILYDRTKPCLGRYGFVECFAAATDLCFDDSFDLVLKCLPLFRTLGFEIGLSYVENLVDNPRSG